MWVFLHSTIIIIWNHEKETLKKYTLSRALFRLLGKRLAFATTGENCSRPCLLPSTLCVIHVIKMY